MCSESKISTLFKRSILQAHNGLKKRDSQTEGLKEHPCKLGNTGEETLLNKEHLSEMRDRCFLI